MRKALALLLLSLPTLTGCGNSAANFEKTANELRELCEKERGWLTLTVSAIGPRVSCTFDMRKGQ